MTCKKLKNNIILILVIIYTFLTCSQTCKASWSTEQIDFVKSKLEIRGYYISKVIGKGKYGIAFLGRTSSSELICFKCVFSKSFSNLEYEIFKIDDIQSCPNITKMLEKFEIEDDFIPMVVITSEFNEGGSLLEKYKFFNERPSEQDALQIICDVSNALQAIHKNGFIHRDIKADNIMISNGRYKLIDFGLTIGIDSPKTKEGFAPYKSPEFLLFTIDGCDDYNEKVDIWALGIMMYHLITGKLPYVQRNSDMRLLSTKELWENSKTFCLSLEDMPLFAPEYMTSLIVSCFAYNPDDRASAEFLHDSSCELLRNFEEK